MVRRVAPLACVTSWALLFNASCENAAVQLPASNGHVIQRIADFGKVDVEAGGRVLEYSFRVTNDRQNTIQIIGIQRSCGCLDARVDDSELEPGESTQLITGLKVSSTGQTTQRIILRYSDNTLETYVLTAFGTVPVELKALPVEPFRGKQHQWKIRLYLIDTTGMDNPGTPSVYGVDGIRIVAQDWVTLEEPGYKGLRPLRLVCNAILDCGEYYGAFPVDVDIRCSKGAACILHAEPVE